MTRHQHILAACTALALTASLAAKPAQQPTRNEKIGQVKLRGKFTATSSERQTLRNTILSSWVCYQKQDVKGFLDTLRGDVTRMTKRSGLQHGAEAVKSQLVNEWSAFERQGGTLSENIDLRNFHIQLDSEKSPKTALVSYWLESSGGGRWDYSDQGLVLQAWTFEESHWKLAHHTESMSLNYDLDQQRPGKATIEFDYVYPVKDLARAVKFYRPILGKPEVVSGDQASFNLGGPRLLLQVHPLDGKSQAGGNLANGYAIFHIANLEAQSHKLLQAGCKFLLGTDKKFRREGPDPSLVVTDPSGNVLVLAQPVFRNDGSKAPLISGFDQSNPFVQSSARLAKAWMGTSTAQVGPILSSNARWFDDSRNRTQGQQIGKSDIVKELPRVHWSQYDRGAAGLQANLQATAIQVRPFDSGAIVSYQAEMSGTGPHSYRERAYVTDVFDSTQHLVEHFSTTAPSSGALALELDYTGYPVTNLKATRRFYSDLLNLGRPYSDTDYLGWWSNFAVFGTYLANLEDDRMPRASRANGYLSLWVSSAKSAYDYAKAHGRSFPIIPAINDKAGISSEPGYRQVVTTDSEDNLILFTEYTGKMR